MAAPDRAFLPFSPPLDGWFQARLIASGYSCLSELEQMVATTRSLMSELHLRTHVSALPGYLTGPPILTDNSALDKAKEACGNYGTGRFASTQT